MRIVFDQGQGMRQLSIICHVELVIQGTVSWFVFTWPLFVLILVVYGTVLIRKTMLQRRNGMAASI